MSGGLGGRTGQAGLETAMLLDPPVAAVGEAMQ